MSVNKVILLGNVGHDPEIRYPEKDHPVAFFSMATNEIVGSERQQITEWHNLVAFGERALFAERYIRKGTKLYVEGRLRTRRYTDKMRIERTRTEIYIENMELLGRQQG